MKNKTHFSLFGDLSAFLNIVKKRQAVIDKSSCEMPEKSGANRLAASLHPNNQAILLTEKKVLAGGDMIASFRSADGKAAYFRPGQYINLYEPDSEVSCPFFIVSPPSEAAQGIYRLYISKRIAANLFETILNASDNSEFRLGEPTGFLYVQPLRDAAEIIVITDETGIGAAIALSAEKGVTAFCKGDTTGLDGIKSFESLSDIPKLSDDVSIFVCGAEAFCDEIRLNVTAKRKIRFFVTGEAFRECAAKSFTCTVICAGDKKDIPCYSNETLVASLEKAGVKSNARCRNGECGYCRCRLIKGDATAVFYNGEDTRRKADIHTRFIHPCRTFPDSDVTIEF